MKLPLSSTESDHAPSTEPRSSNGFQRTRWCQRVTRWKHCRPVCQLPEAFSTSFHWLNIEDIRDAFWMICVIIITYEQFPLCTALDSKGKLLLRCFHSTSSYNYDHSRDIENTSLTPERLCYSNCSICNYPQFKWCDYMFVIIWNAFDTQLLEKGFPKLNNSFEEVTK